jgi:iron complex transport system substrate-binding protein
MAMITAPSQRVVRRHHRREPHRARGSTRALLVALVFALAALACRAPAAPHAQTSARIASQTVLADELLWQLGPAVRARVVAVSPLADDPLYSAVVDQWPADRPRIAGASEALLARAPDLVVLASFNAPETRAFIEAHGVRTLTFDRFASFDDLRGNLRALARAADADAEAELLLQQWDTRLAALAADHSRGRPMLAISWGDGLVAGADTSFDAIARQAGLRNLAAERGLVGHVSLSLEQLVAWDPEVIVLTCEPLPCADAEREFAQRSGVRATQAARRAGIFAIPAPELSSIGAGMISAAERLQARRIALTEPP